MVGDSITAAPVAVKRNVCLIAGLNFKAAPGVE